MVLAEDAVGGDALLDEIRRRADRSPARFTLVLPAEVPTPAWGDEANARRSVAVERVHRAIEDLQQSGVAVQGEVVDGGILAAARETVGAYRPDEILVVSSTEQNLSALRGVARGAAVDQVVVGAGATS